METTEMEKAKFKISQAAQLMEAASSAVTDDDRATALFCMRTAMEAAETAIARLRGAISSMERGQ